MPRASKTLPAGTTIVRWSPSELATRPLTDRPYAARSTGVVLEVCNGGYAVRVLWPHGERVVDAARVVPAFPNQED